MGTRTTLTYAIAAVSLVLLSPNLARAEGVQAAAGVNAPVMSQKAAPGAASEAQQMVRARAALTRTWDANKLKPGDRIEAKLADTVHLKNGTELPNGSTLMGVVATDNMHPGNSKLALRFTEVKTKHGKVIPITATVVGVYGPESTNGLGYDIAAGDQQPNSWQSSELQIDQIDALSGVDLHSRIAGQNSGVFVTTKKDDVKLKEGSELSLAIGPGSNAQNAMNGQGGL